MKELRERIETFVDDVIKDDVDRSRLKKPLTEYLLKYELLRYLMTNASDVGDLEKQLNESAEFLEERIGHVRQFLLQHSHNKKTQVYAETKKAIADFRSDVHLSTENYLSAVPEKFMSDAKRDQLRNLSNDLVALQFEISNTLAMTEYFKLEFPLLVLENSINRTFQQYKALRKKQRRIQRIYR